VNIRRHRSNNASRGRLGNMMPEIIKRLRFVNVE
jgi:hypothetical protein